MPPLFMRILLFCVLAVGLMALAIRGSGDRRAENTRRINTERATRAAPEMGLTTAPTTSAPTPPTTSPTPQATTP